MDRNVAAYNAWSKLSGKQKPEGEKVVKSYITNTSTCDFKRIRYSSTKTATVATEIQKLTSTLTTDNEKQNKLFQRNRGKQAKLLLMASIQGAPAKAACKKQRWNTCLYVLHAIKTAQTAPEPLPESCFHFKAITLVLWESVRCS